MRAGYTLIELLAVTVVMGLAAGIAVPGLVRAAGGDRLAEAASRLEREERQVRRLSHGTGAVLEVESSGWSGRVGDGEVAYHLPLDIEATWRSGGRMLSRLAIDARGLSGDYEVTLRMGDRERSFLIAGLSGEWRARPDPGASP